MFSFTSWLAQSPSLGLDIEGVVEGVPEAESLENDLSLRFIGGEGACSFDRVSKLESY